MSPDQERRLREFLGSLPETLAAPLAQAVERDRLAGGSRLPYDLILSGLRPTLSGSVPPASRIPTPLRLFCQLFEDLLVAEHETPRQPGRIARRSLRPIWQWLRDDLMTDNHEEICLRITKSTLVGNTREKEEAVADLHAAVAVALGNVFEGLTPGTQPYDVVERRLGGAGVLADAQEILMITTIAPVLEKLFRILPRLAGKLSDANIAEIRDLFDEAAELSPDGAHHILLIAFRRLERPWEILKVAKKISHQDAEFLLGSTEFGQIGKLLRDDLDHLAGIINGARADDFDPETLLRALRLYTELSNGLLSEIGSRPTGPFGKEIMGSRQSVAERMERLLNTLAADIPAALPFARGGYSKSGPKRPDLSGRPDERKAERAARAAELLAGCREIASKAAIAVALSEILTDLEEHIDGYGEGLVEALRAAEGEEMEHGEAYLAQAVEIASRLGREEEADLLRRRAAVALRR